MAQEASPLARARPAPEAEPPPASFPFLFINQERLLLGSQAGQRLLAEEETEREALRTEARSIDAAFEEEERRLTEQRADLDPAEFRALADDFDSRVIAARQEQDDRSEALALRFDLRRRQFYASVAPILVRLMDRYRAKAILDETSVLLADQSINITDQVIEEIDAEFAPQDPARVPADAPPAAGPPSAGQD